MTELRQRMINDLTLNGKSKNTIESYVDAVCLLARYYKRSPDLLSEEEIRQFFLHQINVKKLARSTITQYLCGIKFFYEKCLKRKWQLFDLIRPKKGQKLPIVFSIEEVRRILRIVEKPIPKMALTVIYSCGLRLSEGCNLKVRDIDGDRRLLRIDNGKGGDDRIIPIPRRTLELLRSYWDHHRPKPHLFPGTHNPKRPIPDGSLQSLFKIALAQSNITKKGSMHSLRHSYATHLLEKGIPLRVIQKILGHKSVRTTQIYTHLTEETVDSIYPTIDALMADL